MPNKPRPENRHRMVRVGIQARDYDATPEATAEAWADPGVRGFWIDQAGAVLGFLAREGAA